MSFSNSFFSAFHCLTITYLIIVVHSSKLLHIPSFILRTSPFCGFSLLILEPNVKNRSEHNAEDANEYHYQPHKLFKYQQDVPPYITLFPLIYEYIMTNVNENKEKEMETYGDVWNEMRHCTSHVS